MPTLGSTGKPSSTQEGWGLNANNQFAIELTLPSGGPWNITHVGVWCGGWSASPTGKVAVWGTGGDFKRASNSFTIASEGGLSLGAASEYYKALTSPYQVAGGTTVRVGFARDPGEAIQFPKRSGTHYDDYKSSGWPGDASFSSDSGEIGVYLTYEAANSPPNAPINRVPGAGAVLATTDPDFSFDHDDPDSDPFVGYDLDVDNNSDFSSPLWSVFNSNNNISGDHMGPRSYSGSPLSRGVTYYWRARTRDASGAGAWSGNRTFKINSLPDANRTSPLAGRFAEIWNLLTDYAVWTDGGAHAKPRFKWDFTDADGDGQTAFRVRIYDHATNPVAPIHDSGVVASSAKQYDCPLGLVRGTEYYWTLDVQDSHGEWQGENVTRNAFKVQWGQAIYEHAVSGGASSSQWEHAAAAIAAGLGGFLFASATGASGAGRSAWTPNISTLTPAAYLNVLVRLAPAVNATSSNPLLPDMRFDYLTSSGAPPERWVLGTVASDWAIDTTFRRFGSQSLRLRRTAGTGVRYAYPTIDDSGADVTVSPLTHYIMSAYVNTNKAALGQPMRLAVFAAGADPSSATERSDLYTDAAERETLDSTGLGLEDWQRLVLKFATADGMTNLRPALLQPAGAGASDACWLDAIQLEEASRIATPWRPGMVSLPVTVDVQGVTIDASVGGIFRLRGSAGGARDIIELGANGLVYGGDAQISSPAAGLLALPQSIINLRRGISDQSGIVSGATTDIILNEITVESDPGGIFSANLSTGLVTVNLDGWYMLTAGVAWSGGSTGDRQFQIGVGGTTIAVTRTPAANAVNRQNVSRPYFITAGQTVKIQVLHTQGSNMSVQNDLQTFLTIVRLSG